MQFYADSSFLVSLLSEDTNTAAARSFMADHSLALPFNPLHRLEVRNAIRFAVKIGRLDRGQRHAAFAKLDADLLEQLLIYSSVNWTNALRRAEALSAAHTETLGNRAADILHVAIALESGAETFLSFDANQRTLAGAAGLEVAP